MPLAGRAVALLSRCHPTVCGTPRRFCGSHFGGCLSCAPFGAPGCREHRNGPDDQLLRLPAFPEKSDGRHLLDRIPLTDSCAVVAWRNISLHAPGLPETRPFLRPTFSLPRRSAVQAQPSIAYTPTSILAPPSRSRGRHSRRWCCRRPPRQLGTIAGGFESRRANGARCPGASTPAQYRRWVATTR